MSRPKSWRKLSLPSAIPLSVLVGLGALSACNGSGQPALPGPTASSIPSTTSVPLSSAPQELRFAHGSPAVRLQTNDQGQGVMLTSGGANLEALSIYPIENFQVKAQKQSYPELRGRALAAHTLLLSSQGQGQVIAVNSAEALLPNEIGPAVSIPPTPTALELRTLGIQNFKAARAAETHVFKEVYTHIDLNQLLVNADGNGYLSLQVRSTLEDPLRIILIPIKNHQVQPVIEATLDLPVYRSSHQFRKVWINAAKNGLLVDWDETGAWKANTIRQGKLSAETQDLGSNLMMGQPIVKLDAQGQGTVYTIQNDGSHMLARITDFKAGPAEKLELPPLERMASSFTWFEGDQGTVVTLPVSEPLRKSRTYTFHHLSQGRVVASKTLTYNFDPSRILDSAGAFWLTSKGQGLLAWSTVQQGGSNGTLHLQTIDNFLITGPERWISPSEGMAALNPIPTPTPLQRPAS